MQINLIDEDDRPCFEADRANMRRGCRVVSIFKRKKGSKLNKEPLLIAACLFADGEDAEFIAHQLHLTEKARLDIPPCARATCCCVPRSLDATCVCSSPVSP